MKNIFFLILIFFIGCNSPTENNIKENISIVNNNGEALFKANCATCHKPTENYVGPALKGVVKRWENKELLYAFVKKSQEVIGRNEYAKKLFEEYKQSPMLPYPNLSNEDIEGILNYCDTYK